MNHLQCEAITGKGTRCTREAVITLTIPGEWKPRAICRLHQEQPPRRGWW